MPYVPNGAYAFYFNNNIEIDNDYFDMVEVDSTNESEPELLLYVKSGENFELFLDYDTTIYPTKDMKLLLEELRNIIRDICEYPDKNEFEIF